MWDAMLLSIQSSSSEWFWMNGVTLGSGWATYTIAVVILLFLWQFAITTRTGKYRFRSEPAPPPAISPSFSQLRISEIIPDLDLKSLMDKLDGKLHGNEKWDCVIDRRNSSFSYSANCCKPKDGSPLKYLSTTVFEGCSAAMLRDFYMDIFYRKEWDKTLIEHEQLQVDKSNGTEIGRTVKKFPLLTPREYVLAWRLWEGRNGTFYCYSKECDHPLAPRMKKFVRIGFFISGWRIREVPGRNACEIQMFHQEDAGLNVKMAKMIFAKGVWSFVCKMDNALRKYSDISRLQLTATLSAITLVQKVPPAFDSTSKLVCTAHVEDPTSSAISCHGDHKCGKWKLLRRPSHKLIANGLILVGGVICMSRGHVKLSAKITMPYILSKLTKRGGSSNQSTQVSVR